MAELTEPYVTITLATQAGPTLHAFFSLAHRNIVFVVVPPNYHVGPEWGFTRLAGRHHMTVSFPDLARFIDHHGGMAPAQST